MKLSACVSICLSAYVCVFLCLSVCILCVMCLFKCVSVSKIKKSRERKRECVQKDFILMECVESSECKNCV